MTLTPLVAKGEIVNAMDSLNRLNRLLDAREQGEFNRFMRTLSVAQGAHSPASVALPWTPSAPLNKRETLLAAQRSGQFDGLA